MRLSPFVLKGEVLCIYVLIIFVVCLVFTIAMEKSLIYNLAQTTNDLGNQANITRMKFGWILAAICRVFMFCLTLPHQQKEH